MNYRNTAEVLPPLPPQKKLKTTLARSWIMHRSVNFGKENGGIYIAAGKGTT
jgi:hypothetical protein